MASNVLWLEVVSALVDALDTALDVPVFDGSPNTGDSLSAFVCVGAVPEDVDGIAEPNAGTFTQTYHDLGPAATRDERGSVACYIDTWSGDPTFTALRTSAFALLDTINDTLRDDPTLAVSATMAPELELDTVAVRQGFTDAGARVQLVFTIRYRAIL